MSKSMRMGAAKRLVMIGLLCLAAASCAAQKTVKCSVAELKSQTFEDGKTYRLVITNKEPNIGRLRERLNESGARFELDLTNCERLTEIGEEAFSGCKFTKITLPSSLTKIGEHAFNGCVNLSEITIPSSVTEIGVCLFWDCPSLKKVRIPRHLQDELIRIFLAIPETAEIEYY